MNLIENMKEGMRSIKANMLRSVLTALIVAIGITSLVGILTAIDGIERSVNESLAGLGVNTFDINSRDNRGGSSQGVTQKTYTPLKLSESLRFIELYNVPSSISLSANLSWNAEIKHMSAKTNPNVRVQGSNEEFLAINGLELQKGRGFSKIEIGYGTNVAIIGHKIYTTLFKENEDPINSKISVLGTQFKVIGVIVEKGNFAEDNFDNMVVIPIRLANQMAKGRNQMAKGLLRSPFRVGRSEA